MSAKKLLQLLEKNKLVSGSMLRELQRQIGEKSKPVSAATIAKALVEKGVLTKFQATKLVGEATSESDLSDELGLAEEPAAAESSTDEVVLLEDARGTIQLEEVPGLTPVEDAGAALTPVASTRRMGGGGLQPLDSGLGPLESGLQPLDGGLQPLDPVADSFAPPAAPTKPVLPGKGRPGTRGPKAQEWGTKTILGGVLGLLLLMLVGALLLYNYLKTPAVAMFNAAQEAYRSESYTDALEKYQAFIKAYPKDENVDEANIKIVYATLRIYLHDPEQAYAEAKAKLPPLLELEGFREARDELTLILPNIPEGFVNRAKQANSLAAKEELVKKTETSLQDLVEAPEYIPASKKPDIKPRVDRIKEQIILITREISQDRDLAAAITEINSLIDGGETPQANEVVKQLLRTYPGVAEDASLMEAMQKISQREKALVKSVDQPLTVSKSEEAPKSDYRVVLGIRSGNGVASLKGRVVSVLAGGSVYGLDAGTGQTLWRRFVGYGTKAHPIPVSNQPEADLLVTNSQQKELARVKALTGEVVWRAVIGEPFAAPAVESEAIFVTTEGGHLLQLAAATGEGTKRVVIPQKLNVSPATSLQFGIVVQPGEQSNLYVISGQTAACQQVLYLGHKPGTISVPPLIVENHVLVAENAGRDYCNLHVFKVASSDAGPQLTKQPTQFRLAGNVVTPMILAGRRPVVVTDRGEINVYNIDFASDENTVTLATETLPASLAQPAVNYPLVEGSNLIIADNDKLSRYKIQVTTKKIQQESVGGNGESFIAPPRLFEDILVVTRRLAGSAGATLSAFQVDNLRVPLWNTSLGLPVPRAEFVDQKLRVISAGAALFDIAPSKDKTWYSDQPTEAETLAGSTASFTEQLELGDGKVAFFNPADPTRALVYVPQDTTNRLRLTSLQLPSNQVPCGPVAFKNALLVATGDGLVSLLNVDTGGKVVLPFQPKLGPGEDVGWRRPAVVGDEFIIADDRQAIYRIGIKSEPQPFLAELAQARLEINLQSDLAAAGDTVYGVVRNPSGDVVVAITAADLTVAKEFPLEGHISWGPVQVDGLVFCLSDREGLMCFEQGAAQRWKVSAGYGHPTGSPLHIGDDFVFASTEGVVTRIAGATGEQIARADVGEPLGMSPVQFTRGLLLGGLDGTLYVMKMPGAEG